MFVFCNTFFHLHPSSNIYSNFSLANIVMFLLVFSEAHHCIIVIYQAANNHALK